MLRWGILVLYRLYWTRKRGIRYMKIEGHHGNKGFKFRLLVSKENEKFFGILIFLFGIVWLLLK